MFYKRPALFIFITALLSTPCFALSKGSEAVISSLRAKIAAQSLNKAKAPCPAKAADNAAAPYIAGKELCKKYADYKNKVYGDKISPEAVYKKVSSKHLPEEFLGKQGCYRPGKALAMRLAEYRLARGLYYKAHKPDIIDLTDLTNLTNINAEATAKSEAGSALAKAGTQKKEAYETKELDKNSILFSAPNLVVKRTKPNKGLPEDDYNSQMLKSRLLYFKNKHKNKLNLPQDKTDLPCIYADKAKKGQNISANEALKQNEAADDKNKNDNAEIGRELGITPFVMPKNYRVIVR